MSKIYDISRTVAPDLQVWPGDTAFSAAHVLRLPAGLPARIEFTTTAGIVRDVPASFTRLDRFTFENAAYADTSQRRLLIEVQTITGGLRVLEQGGL